MCLLLCELGDFWKHPRAGAGYQENQPCDRSDSWWGWGFSLRELKLHPSDPGCHLTKTAKKGVRLGLSLQACPGSTKDDSEAAQLPLCSGLTVTVSPPQGIHIYSL